MGLHEDLDTLHREGQKAYELIEAGRLGAAQGVLSRIKRSWYVSDALRIAVPLEGLIFFLKDKKRHALELLQENISYIWGDSFALELMRACLGEAPTAKTRLHRLRVRGGMPVLGMFTQFGPEYVTAVDVYADDEFEAFRFLDRLLPFQDPAGRILLEFSEIEAIDYHELDFKGIYSAAPFSVDSNEVEAEYLG
jgi:hypothetical protein